MEGIPRTASGVLLLRSPTLVAMSEPIHVLLLCWRDTTHPQGGGSERYLERVGAELVERGMRVTLLTAAYDGAPAIERWLGVSEAPPKKRGRQIFRWFVTFHLVCFSW